MLNGFNNLSKLRPLWLKVSNKPNHMCKKNEDCCTTSLTWWIPQERWRNLLSAWTSMKSTNWWEHNYDSTVHRAVCCYSSFVKVTRPGTTQHNPMAIQLMNCHGLEVHCITLMEQNKQLESGHMHSSPTWRMKMEEALKALQDAIFGFNHAEYVLMLCELEDMRDISSCGQLWIGDLFNINMYTENKMVEDMMYLWKQVLRYEGPHAFPSIAINQFISLQIHSKLFSLYLASDSEKSKTKVPQHALEDIGLSTPSSNQRVWLKRWPS